MKTKFFVWVVFLVAACASAQTNSLTSALQKGLFEEEANRNLDAAISNYRSLAEQFDQDRQVAATAIFRLGECYRKLGRTNDAVVQYQRILREFDDQPTLATLSRQNLAGLGVASQPRFQQRLAAVITRNPQDSSTSTGAEPAAKAAEVEKEFILLKSQLELARSETNLFAVARLFGDTNLDSALKSLERSEEGLGWAKQNPSSTNIAAWKENIAAWEEGVRADRYYVDKARKSLLDYQELRLRSLESASQQARAGQLVPGSIAGGAAAVVTDDEDQEIRRLQAMILNSPDLINAPIGTGEDKHTPLCLAAINGQLRVAAFLLDNSADINQRDNFWTPLHYAANTGHKRMVDLLLGRGADVNAQTGRNKTALHLAMERNFPAVAETLLAARADVNAADDYGITPLMLAANNGNRKLAAAMLALGADPNLQNKSSRARNNSPSSVEQVGTALHVAAWRNDAIMVALLLTNRAEVMLRNDIGYSPLDVAAMKGATEAAAQLIAAGADVNAAGPVNPTGGATPLFLAVANGRRDVVKLLLEHGANPNTASISSGLTPLMQAARNGNTELAGLLLDHRARTDPEDKYRETALFKAVANEKVDLVQLLLAHGANPNERDHGGDPFLTVVTTDKSNPDMLAAFLKAKADVNAANSYDYTALHRAVVFGRKDLVEMLLAAGADPNLRNNDGKTPLDLVKETQAGYSGSQKKAAAGQLADLLRQHGALDDWPDFNSITALRPSTNSTYMVFRKGTNNWNRFTLLELIGQLYGFVSTSYTPASGVTAIGQWEWNKNSLRFPDFRLVTIQRAVPGAAQRKTINVDVESLLRSGECSDNVPLQWGDRVEIPEADHPVDQIWAGLDANQITTLVKCVSRNVTLILKGTTNSIAVGPYFRPSRSDLEKPLVPGLVFYRYYTNGSALYDSTREPMQKAPGCFMLTATLRGSGLLRASSDLTRVKVTRRDAKTGKKLEWVLDCSGDHTPDLWLRDGDVIEVPEK